MTKRWYVRGLEGFVLTSYGAKERSRRRAASKVARKSRQVNQAFHRRTGR